MADSPYFYTVEEAAEIVRIGRTLAYQLAARYEATGGADGLPVVRIGRLLRVPRIALEAWAGCAIDDRPDAAPPAADGAAHSVADTNTVARPVAPAPDRPNASEPTARFPQPRRLRATRPHVASSAQRSLPFTG